jgi:methylmalonyl-CoA/ethylmalonyl-CoA epimerase
MATPSPLGLSRIGQIAINVHDLGRAMRFYRDALGMKFMFEVPKMAFFDCDGVRLMLALPETTEFDHPASVIYYKVGDIQSAHQTLMSRNVVFDAAPHIVARMPNHDLWMAFFRDPEGNLLALMSEVAHQR